MGDRNKYINPFLRAVPWKAHLSGWFPGIEKVFIHKFPTVERLQKSEGRVNVMSYLDAFGCGSCPKFWTGLNLNERVENWI